MHERPWAVVVAATLAYDVWLIRRRNDSLSRHFAAAARRRPITTSVALCYLLAHLYGVLPARGDAFRLGLALTEDK